MADTERKLQGPRDKAVTESEKKELILNYNLGMVLSKNRKYDTEIRRRIGIAKGLPKTEQTIKK